MSFIGVLGATTVGTIGAGAGMGGSMLGLTGFVGGGLIGAKMAQRQLGRFVFEGTSFSNPMFPTATPQGYGKRGIDANNMNTGGLSLSLHRNRRKF